MRYYILIVMALLAGCNQSDNDSAYATTAQLPPSEATAIAALKAQVATLQSSVEKLQLIGNSHGVVSAARTLAIGASAARAEAVNFGPCTDMGVLIGRGGKDSNIPLASALESFQTCTGYAYTVSALDGTIQGPPYAAYDQPNCTGNLLIITDIPGDGFNPQVVNNGVVFTDPVSNMVLMIKAGSIPHSQQIQSAINLGPGGGVCGSPDIETRMVVSAQLNDISITGVQSAPIPLPITIAAP